MAVTSVVLQGGHITVCGDTHGQYYDLMHIWDLNGLPSSDNPYLFNGTLRACARVFFCVACVCWMAQYLQSCCLF